MSFVEILHRSYFQHNMNIVGNKGRKAQVLHTWKKKGSNSLLILKICDVRLRFSPSFALALLKVCCISLESGENSPLIFYMPLLSRNFLKDFGDSSEEWHPTPPFVPSSPSHAPLTYCDRHSWLVIVCLLIVWGPSTATDYDFSLIFLLR